MGKMISNNINAKTDRRKQVIHLAVEILAAVAVALLLEFAFNYHAITEGYSSITIMVLHLLQRRRQFIKASLQNQFM